MRILYHSAPPWTHTGYGRCTQEIAPRLHNNGHEVAIHPLSLKSSSSLWWHGDELEYSLNNKIKIMSAKGTFGLDNVEESIEKFDADFYFAHFDTWMKPAREKIPNLDIQKATYNIIDHDPVPKAVLESLAGQTEIITMSEYAKHKLQEKNIHSITIPHGVDTDSFYPLENTLDFIEVRNEKGKKEEINIDDTFIIGMVAANHGDRKNIPNHLKAFKIFLDEVDSDALMYLHTDINSVKGYNLIDVINHIGIPEKNIIWAQGEDYGEVGKEFLNKWYNAFDVMVNCSYGESWGLTITEAQSAGTPTIVTNFSSMPEQLGIDSYSQLEANEKEKEFKWITEDKIGKANHGLLVEPTTEIWRERLDAKQYIVSPEDIKEALMYYYNNPEIRKEDGKKARKYVVNNYDWESKILPQFVELFNEIENVVL